MNNFFLNNRTKNQIIFNAEKFEGGMFSSLRPKLYRFASYTYAVLGIIYTNYVITSVLHYIMMIDYNFMMQLVSFKIY